MGPHRFRPWPGSHLTIAAGVPLLVTVILAAVWTKSGRLPLFGDEPHYVIMAESIARDADLELRNNYALEDRAPQFVGTTDPHVWRAGHRWYSLHGPGLGLVLVPGLELAGVLGARLTTCALAVLLPLSLFVWLDRRLGQHEALALTLVATLSVPYVFGAIHLYPDSVAAALLAPLLLWLASPDLRRRRPWVWAVFWALVGFLPLLMIKFLAPAALTAAFACLSCISDQESTAGRRARRHFGPLLLAGPLALMAYHLLAFGSLGGPRGLGEISPAVGQAWMVFLGLHLDQAQGMFLQLPLLLAGLPAIGIVAMRRPGFAAAWCGLYASLIVPNALQVIPYGGASPSGRFGWPAAWLWIVPIALVYGWDRHRLLRFGRPMLGAVALYEAALAVRWLPKPMTITNEFTADLTLRNSLFPLAVRGWLPSFYSADFLSHPPNLVATLIVIALLASGPIVELTRGRPETGGRITNSTD